MRVTITDDSSLFRHGLASLLAATDIKVSWQAADTEEMFVRLESDGLPDVAILDIRMPPTFTDEGLRAALIIRNRYPSVGVLVLSTYAETAYAAQLVQDVEGSIGYLLKDRVDDIGTLTDAIVRIARGETVVDPDIVRRLLRRRDAGAQCSRWAHRARKGCAGADGTGAVERRHCARVAHWRQDRRAKHRQYLGPPRPQRGHRRQPASPGCPDLAAVQPGCLTTASSQDGGASGALVLYSMHGCQRRCASAACSQNRAGGQRAH